MAFISRCSLLSCHEDEVTVTREIENKTPDCMIRFLDKKLNHLPDN